MNEKEKRKKKFGEYLNLLRQTKNVSVKEVAEATGISDPYLYQVEKGQKALTDPEYLKRLAYYFNIEISELLKKAGYIPESDTEQKTEKIYLKCINDPDFETGKFLKNEEVSFSTKLFIAELYEKILSIKNEPKISEKAKMIDLIEKTALDSSKLLELSKNVSKQIAPTLKKASIDYENIIKQMTPTLKKASIDYENIMKQITPSIKKAAVDYEKIIKQVAINPNFFKIPKNNTSKKDKK